MSIEINFEKFSIQTEETLTQRVQFVFSPLNELFRSLHILLNPRHHGLHMKWIVESQKKMTAEMYRDLQYFRLFYELGTPTIFLPSTEKFIMTLDDEIELLKKRLQTASPESITAFLSEVTKNRENSFIPELAKGLEWGHFELKNEENIIKDLLQDADTIYQRLFNFLATYRRIIFDDYWRQKNIEQFLLDEIENATKILHQGGFRTLLNQLQLERMKFDGQKLIIFKPFDERLYFSDTDALLFAPSYFVYPHLFVEKFSKGMFITYDCLKQTRKPLKIDDLSKIFFALSDPARLEIVSYLHKEKSTTQALAQLLSYTSSNISKQLRLLKDAKLVESEKQGKYVFYSATSLFEDILPNFELFAEGL